MKMTLSTNQAADLLKADENANWSYAGAKALVEYLEEIEEAGEEERELDIVAIRCEFSEYVSASECIHDAGYTPEICIEECEDDEEREGAWLEWLREETLVIEFDGGIIVQDF